MYTLEELACAAAAELRRISYPEPYMRRHQHCVNRFLDYSGKKQATHFTETLGEEFLSDKFGYPQEYQQGRLVDYVQRHVRAVRILGDYQQFGIIKRSSRRVKLNYPDQHYQVIEGFRIHEINDGRAAATAHNKARDIGLFLCYMITRDVFEVRGIKAHHIQNYLQTLAGCTNATIRARTTSMRRFLQYLYNQKLIDSDLSRHVPKVKTTYTKHLPQVWKKSEVERLLTAVDRSNPCGKRDYAILLMITRLGLRRSDVESMPLDAIDWTNSTISLIQRKTGGPLALPLPQDVGEAIIDYLKYARPDNGCPYLFLKMRAPYNQNISMGNIMNKYVVKAGLDIGGRAHGLHTLRHTLASRLLEDKVPISTISAILGHSSINSTQDYLHIDVDELRRCSLELTEGGGI